MHVIFTTPNFSGSQRTLLLIYRVSQLVWQIRCDAMQPRISTCALAHHLATMHLSAIFRVHHLSEKAPCQRGHSAMLILQPSCFSLSLQLAALPTSVIVSSPSHRCTSARPGPSDYVTVAKKTRLRVLELCARDKTLEMQPIFSSYSVLACLGRSTSRRSAFFRWAHLDSQLRTCTYLYANLLRLFVKKRICGRK